MKYGPDIELDLAEKIMASAKAEAAEQGWPVCIAIVDNHGVLVMLCRMPQTQLGSIEVAQQKAATAARFRRPSFFFEDALSKGGGNMKWLQLPGCLPIEGGLPIVQEGQVIGGIGVSGVLSTQDAEVAQAGLAVLA